jgi:L-cystine uptake protein TcyP (sodium:dicarboxylate symporter family)
MLLSNTGTWMQIIAQWLSFSLLLVAGAAQAVTSSVSITLMQLNTPRDMMGLLMSINTFVIMGIRHWVHSPLVL